MSNLPLNQLILKPSSVIHYCDTHVIRIAAEMLKCKRPMAAQKLITDAAKKVVDICLGVSGTLNNDEVRWWQNEKDVELACQAYILGRLANTRTKGDFPSEAPDGLDLTGKTVEFTREFIDKHAKASA